MPKKVVTFGEIMMRLSPPGFQRFGQARSFDVIYGGGEANVAVSLANYGVPVEFVTRLPENDLGDACLQFLRQYGVGTDQIVRGGERLGIYFLEMGAVQRGSKVIYDRADSSIATIEPGMIDWQAVFADADWFHWTGITPAISEGRPRVCLEAVQTAQEMGLTVSCDLNYRNKLWKWGKKAGEVMPELVAVLRRGHRQRGGRGQGVRHPRAGDGRDRGQGRGGQVPLRLRGAQRALPQPEDDRHHAARLGLGQPQHVVGRAVGRRAVLHRAAPTTSRTSWTASAAAIRSWAG